jgi:hypothetical protein
MGYGGASLSTGGTNAAGKTIRATGTSGVDDALEQWRRPRGVEWSGSLNADYWWHDLNYEQQQRALTWLRTHPRPRDFKGTNREWLYRELSYDLIPEKIHSAL